jgi:hypothetical protein
MLCKKREYFLNKNLMLHKFIIVNEWLIYAVNARINTNKISVISIIRGKKNKHRRSHATCISSGTI